MGRKGTSQNQGAGGGAAGQCQSGKKRGPFTPRNFAIARFAVVCGLFFLQPGGPTSTTQCSHRANKSPDHVELGSRHLAVRTSTYV